MITSRGAEEGRTKKIFCKEKNMYAGGGDTQGCGAGGVGKGENSYVLCKQCILRETPT